MNRTTKLSGAWLKLAKAAGGVTELGKALGVSASTVWRWSEGKVEISRWHYQALSTYAERLGYKVPHVKVAER
jgi:hypothetical protein